MEEAYSEERMAIVAFPIPARPWTMMVADAAAAEGMEPASAVIVLADDAADALSGPAPELLPGPDAVLDVECALLSAPRSPHAMQACRFYRGWMDAHGEEHVDGAADPGGVVLVLSETTVAAVGLVRRLLRRIDVPVELHQLPLR